MKSIIYIDYNTDGTSELKAKTDINPDRFNEFKATLKPEQIIFYDGVLTTDNVPEEHKEILPVFLRSMGRFWHTRQVLVAPSMVPEVGDNVLEPLPPVEAPTAPEKPKRKPRAKKKEKTNE